MINDSILAIDPGSRKSAYAVLDADLRPIEFAIVTNEEMLNVIDRHVKNESKIVIENVASYGMSVGATVFQTCIWIGRFTERAQASGGSTSYVYRMDVKMNLCHDSRAKDGNIRQALIDRFGPIGVKKNPGWFYGVKKDVWSAIACGVTYHDLYLAKQNWR